MLRAARAGRQFCRYRLLLLPHSSFEVMREGW
jgi:hypothetical protein